MNFPTVPQVSKIKKSFSDSLMWKQPTAYIPSTTGEVPFLNNMIEMYLMSSWSRGFITLKHLLLFYKWSKIDNLFFKIGSLHAGSISSTTCHLTPVGMIPEHRA